MIRVVIADGHTIVREGLRLLLSSETDVEVIAEACDGESAARRAAGLRPDVMLMDVAMPVVNGIDAMHRILEATPSVRVLMVSAHVAARFVVEALNAGASGFVSKSCEYAELMRAIRAVAAGETYLSPETTGVVLKDYVARRPATATSACLVLSERERRVLQLIAEGLRSKEIALRLGLSVRTVEKHRCHIMDKLAIDSIAGLTKYAIREGLTPCDVTPVRRPVRLR